MAKKNKDEVKAEKAEKAEGGAVAWAEPFPASVLKPLGKDGKLVETVMVRAVPKQDIIINGQKLPAGQEVEVGADFAHHHAGMLDSPKDVEPTDIEE